MFISMCCRRLPARLAVVLIITVVAGLGLQAQERNPADRNFPVIQLPAPARGAAALNALGAHLPEIAQWYGKSLDELRSIILRDRTIWTDRHGRLLYICEQDPPPPEAPAAEEGIVTAEGPVPYDQTFLLHSRPGVTRVIYLDFDGHTTTGTPWNSGYGDPIVSAPFDLDGSPLNWSATELDRIQYIWQRVAEDFAMYDVDVTTQDPGIEGLRKTSSGDASYGQRVVISPTNWYNTNAGGVAYLGSFNWNSDTPCYAFAAQLANGEKYIAEAASHETGHTLGLHHDGTTAGVTYYQGHGDWAPIMGVGYYKPIVQWSRGEYANANNTEDDLAIMTNYGFGLRPDDHGDYVEAATLLSGTSLSASGVIEANVDADLFRFLSGAGNISITVNPGPREPNLDVEVKLFNGAGQVITTGNPTGLPASITATVPEGTYYLRIDGVGTGDPSTGYSDYSSLGQYTISGSVPPTSGNQPPTAVASATPTTGQAPLTVQFDGSGSTDPDGTIATYLWNFGDGATSTGASATHQYAAAGVFTATLLVTDNGGMSGSDAMTITVTEPPNQSPVAVASANPASGNAPLAVSFSSAGSYDPDGSIVSYSWSFGDGASATGATASHTYGSAGTYNPTLTVTDNRGASNSKSVTVVVAPDPSKVLHVSNIAMSLQVSGTSASAQAVVSIVNAPGTPIPNATITGRWSGLVAGTATAKTDAGGNATFNSKSTKKRGTFTFTVTGVTASGYSYDPSKNTETSDSVTR